jgi:predicted metal-dependent phosphoesterase TrpH
MNAFFAEYLVPGAKAFVPRRWPTADEAVSLIHDAGGVAVVAHPYWDVKDPGQVETLIGALDVEGVEAFYPDHSREQTEHLLAICSRRDLVPTASSDFHGPTHKTFSRFGAYQTYGLGEPEVPAKP